MSNKTGKPYENLTRVIFQEILNQKEIPNVAVEQNVTLQGKTASHQIDVYWKFEVARVTHETIVQAKDWNKPVDQLHLLAFKEILDDLPGQPRGIFVTRSGYQKGAKQFALAHGILIYELKEFENDKPALAVTAGGWAHFRLVQMPLHGLITTGEPSVDPEAPLHSASITTYTLRVSLRLASTYQQAG
jgi:Restriction endonuclease